VLLPDDVDWRAHTKVARSADSGQPVSDDLPLIVD
jgi:hypothetical protein